MRFLHYDVFTERVFEGNQLAVFPDAQGVSEATMQAIAREMNFSESTFILPPEVPGTDVRMRIFTPGRELPMAGHPTIGSTFALAHLGVIAPRRDRWVFGLGVGPTPVELSWSDERLSFAWMDQQLPDVRVPPTPPTEIVKAIGLSPDEVPGGLPIEEISCGTNYILIPLSTRAAVDAAEPDLALMRRVTSAFPGDRRAIFVFSAEQVDGSDATAYSRMFAPDFGITEDPATGGASGPLGCYLVAHDLVPGGAVSDMISLQGVKMGRRSRIHIRITSADRTIARVQVGGTAVRVGSGELAI